MADLVSISAASQVLGLSYWQVSRRIGRDLDAVKLPNGARAVTRESVERLRAKQAGEA